MIMSLPLTGIRFALLISGLFAWCSLDDFDVTMSVVFNYFIKLTFSLSGGKKEWLREMCVSTCEVIIL